MYEFIQLPAVFKWQCYITTLLLRRKLPRQLFQLDMSIYFKQVPSYLLFILGLSSALDN